LGTGAGQHDECRVWAGVTGEVQRAGEGDIFAGNQGVTGATHGSSNMVEDGATDRIGGTASGMCLVPFTVEHRVDELAAPFALEPLVLDQVRLEPHAQPLHEAGGGAVACVAAALDTVEASLLEPEAQQLAGRLIRVPLAMVVRVEDESDLRLPMRFARPAQRYVADDLAGPL